MIDDTILHEMRNDITAKEIPAAAFGTPRLTAGAGRRGVETDTAEVAVRSFTGVVPSTGMVPMTGMVPRTGMAPCTGMVPCIGMVPVTEVAPRTGMAPMTEMVPMAGMVPMTGVAPHTGMVPMTRLHGPLGETHGIGQIHNVAKVFLPTLDVLRTSWQRALWTRMR